jgi:hypothetical protein
MSVETQETADLLHLVSREGDRAQIRFGECETVVSLKVSTDTHGVTQVAQSHWILPPHAVRPRKPQSFAGVAANRALGVAIGDLSFAFRRGLSQGHHPDESWFVSVPALALAG